MNKRDYYEVLGVDKNSDASDIKKAFRQLAMEFHPDRKPDDPQAEEKIKEINEAYAVLSDPEKRKLYDTYGHQGLQGFSQEDLFRGVDFSSLFREFGVKDLFGFGDPFESFFGGRSSQRKGPQKGADLRYDLTVSLEEAAFGVEKTINIPKWEPCAACQGTGASPGGMEKCDQCQGSGQNVTEQRKGPSLFRQIRVCNRCQGQGQIIKQPCPECKGQRFIERSKELTVKIPPGADGGYVISVEGEGEKGKDLPGDLHIVLNVARHSLFERHGDDLYLPQEIPFPTAVLGGLIDVPLLGGGTSELKVPEGTQTGSLFRIDGQGVPHLKGQGRGDEYVLIKVTVPTDLTKRQKKLIREFEKLEKEKAPPLPPERETSFPSEAAAGL